MRFRMYAGAMLLVWSGAILGAQTVRTPEELDKVMKKVGPAMQALQKAMGAGNYAEVRTQLAIVRQNVLESQSFWVEHKKDDALKFNQETIAKIDEFEKMVSSATVEAPAAAASLKAVGGSCRTCHQKYRATDGDNDYIIKPGSMGN